MGSLRLLSITARNYSGIGNDGITFELGGSNAALCGPNNTGKTAVLSALSFLSRVLIDQPLTTGVRNDGLNVGWIFNIGSATHDLFHRGAPQAEFAVTLQAKKKDFSVSLPNVPSEDSDVCANFDFLVRPGQKLLTSLSINGRRCFEVLPSLALPNFIKLDDAPQVNAVLESVRQLTLRIIYFDAHRSIRSTGGAHGPLNQLASGLGLIDWVRNARNPNARDPNSIAQHALLLRFEKEFSEFSGLPDFMLSVAAQSNEMNVSVGGQLLPISAIGSGISECLIILLVSKLGSQLRPPVDVILLDEPELHLHPQLQRKLLGYLSSYGIQLIVATHSTTVLNAVQGTGGRIFRTSLDTEGEILVEPVTDVEGLLALLREIGVSAADILQAEKVLWVEGPTDVPVFKAWLAKAPSFRGQIVAVVPLGGNAIDSPSFDVAQLAKLNPNALVILDSERTDETAAPEANRRQFLARCERVGIRAHLTKYHATENYFSTRALKAIYGSLPDKLNPFADVVSQFSPFSKRRNGAVASVMDWSELETTDVGEALEDFLQR